VQQCLGPFRYGFFWNYILSWQPRSQAFLSQQLQKKLRFDVAERSENPRGEGEQELDRPHDSLITKVLLIYRAELQLQPGL
jgi:hypothetical protein